MTISIIIPVYNAEKYLSRCLDSILMINSVDIECICIDDGSTDHSWDIICKYAKISNRFVSKQKENGGVSSARNLGIELCSGDKIMFVDPDDYFFVEANELLYKAVTDYDDYDMILFQWADIYPDGVKKIIQIPKVDFSDDNDWVKKTVLFECTMDTCWSRMFKHSIIVENNIRFDTSMRVSEDGSFVAEYLKYIHTITAVTENVMYAYCVNSNSAIRRFFKSDIFDELQTYNQKLNLAQKKKIAISLQEKRKMNSLFLRTIDKYACRCAKYCSRKKFKNIMSDVLENNIYFEIICNSDTAQDIFLMKNIKFLLCNKLLDTYWCLVIFRNQIRGILTARNKFLLEN